LYKLVVAIEFPQFHPSTVLHNHKALLLGINYSPLPEDVEPEDRPSPLVGLVNDVKEKKKMLIGGARSHLHPIYSLTRSMVTTIEIYHYREDDVFMMPDGTSTMATHAGHPRRTL
jgi:hypothetical protein